MTFLRSLLTTALVASLSAAGIACSIVSPETKGGGVPVANDRETFVRAVCDQYMPCCSKLGKPSDGTTCRAFLGSFATGTYDAASGNKCLSEMQAASSSATFCSDGFSSPHCSRALQGSGTRKPGETCSENSDCATSPEGTVECASVYVDGATTRKCQLQVIGKLGDSPCIATLDGSTRSITYSGSPSPELPARGYLCDVKDGLRCDGDARKCVAIGKLGEPCAGFDEYACTRDAYCDSATRSCAPRKAIGEACAGFSMQCVETAYCGSGTCKAVVPVGGACTTGSECASNRCVNDKCAADDDLAILCGGS